MKICGGLEVSTARNPTSAVTLVDSMAARFESTPEEDEKQQETRGGFGRNSPHLKLAPRDGKRKETGEGGWKGSVQTKPSEGGRKINSRKIIHIRVYSSSPREKG